MIVLIPAVVGLGLWAGEPGLMLLTALAIQLGRAFVLE